MVSFILVFLITVVALLAGAGFLHLLPRMGKAGESLAEDLCRAPLLDVPITYFTVAPMIVGSVAAGWVGFVAAIAAQVLAVVIWSFLHEFTHPEARDGPRIVKEINKRVGPFRNHAALWMTALIVPIFWLIRVAEFVLYPLMVFLVRFPRYNQGDWINVSRHKFNGLVGHDLIWCLYCDWMTGVWSFATEVLRNVESFWCPIRFDSEKKCEHCRQDFPDLDDGWIDSSGSMEDVTDLLDKKYPATGEVFPWFGHAIRLTVKGREPKKTKK